jgi:hypothetical protein
MILLTETKEHRSKQRLALKLERSAGFRCRDGSQFGVRGGDAARSLHPQRRGDDRSEREFAVVLLEHGMEQLVPLAQFPYAGPQRRFRHAAA